MRQPVLNATPSAATNESITQRVSRYIATTRHSATRHGYAAALFQMLLGMVNKLFPVQVLRCVLITELNPAALVVDSRYRRGFLAREALQQYALDAENELPMDFLHEALTKHDECYAIIDDEQLAAYGWYSQRDTLTDVHDLRFCFSSDHVYMYKGYTKNAYRGQRLHAAAMSWALKHYLECGHRGIVSYVDACNFDSLKSCYRMGYRNVGAILVIKLFGVVRHFSTAGCERLQIRLRAATAGHAG